MAVIPVLLIHQASGVTLTKETVHKAIIEKAARANFCETDPNTKACRESTLDREIIFGTARLFPIGTDEVYGSRLTILLMENNIYRSAGFSTVEDANKCLLITQTLSVEKEASLEPSEIKQCHTREEGTAIAVEKKGDDESKTISYAVEHDMNGIIQKAEVTLPDGKFFKLKNIQKVAENINWIPVKN